MPIYPFLLRLGHRGVYPTLLLAGLHFLDVLEARESSIDQCLPRTLLEAVLNLIQHAGQLTLVIALRENVHAYRHLTLTRRAVLDVVRRAVAPIRHFHHRRFRVRCRDTHCLFSPGLIFASISGKRSRACSIRSMRSSA